jgi:hypothetical protein
MTKSIREQICERVMDLLQPVAVASKASLIRSPTLAVPEEDCPALLVYPVKGSVAVKNVAERTLSVRVTVLARGSDTITAELQADALMVLAHRALMSKENWGGLCQKVVDEDWELDTEDADPEVVAIPMNFLFEFRTAVDDLTVKR